MPLDMFDHSEGQGGRQSYCRPCAREYNGLTNPDRVFVNGTYVGMTATIGIPGGNYKTWDHALATLVYRKASVRRGHVYVITNKAWAGWCKIGRALEANDRLQGFNTGSPHRDYRLYGAATFKDRYKAEAKAHRWLADAGFEQKGEWFKVTPRAALNLLLSLQGCS